MEKFRFFLEGGGYLPSILFKNWFPVDEDLVFF